jgi:hypothetical protein
MPDLKPSEELLGQAHRSMRADLRLLCGIYDQLAALNARLATRGTVPATPKAQRATPKPAPKE